MQQQIQSLLKRRQTAELIIISMLNINAESKLKSVLDSFWKELDLIDKSLREITAKDLSLQEIKNQKFNNETN